VNQARNAPEFRQPRQSNKRAGIAVTQLVSAGAFLPIGFARIPQRHPTGIEGLSE